MDIKQYDFWEHRSEKYLRAHFPEDHTLQSKRFGRRSKRYAYEVHPGQEHFTISAGYYIGVDWLADGHSTIVVAPKLNSRLQELLEETANDADELELDEALINDAPASHMVNVDYFALLQQCLNTDYLYQEIDDLIHIDWSAPEIPIRHEADWLSPLIIVKFLNALRVIVRKGLKKSYYQTIQNLNSKVKGKILVGRNIKDNLGRNKLTHTICQFEEFGVDSLENRLLKKAFNFCQGYLDAHGRVLGQHNQAFMGIVNFCRPAFQSVSDEVNVADVKNYKSNAFFKEYTEAIQLAKLILKRFAYSIANTTSDVLRTPPYWIDMPKLFELYVYHFLKSKFISGIKEVDYHLTTHGNELDFLINSGETRMVVDAKYKPYYRYGVNHQDIRQVSGYARLEKIYKHFGLTDHQLLDCLIIYPDLENGHDLTQFCAANLTETAVKGYRRVFKIGIKIPIKPTV